MIERAVILKTVTPDDDIWDAIGKGQLPARFKNRFAMLPELTKDLPKKDYEGDDAWLIRPENGSFGPSAISSKALSNAS